MELAGIPCYRCNKKLSFQTGCELREHLKTVHSETIRETATSERSHEGNQIDKIEKENEMKNRKLCEDLMAKQALITQMQKEISLLKEKNLKYENLIGDMNSFQVEDNSYCAARNGKQDKHCDDMTGYLQRSYKKIYEENQKVHEENRTLKFTCEMMKKEEQMKRSEKDEQLKIAVAQFEESQIKLNKMEKFCIQQRLEIDELDEVIENLRQTAFCQQQKTDKVMNENSRLEQENARLVQEVKTALQARADEEENEKKSTQKRIQDLGRRLKEEQEKVKYFEEKMNSEALIRENLSQKVIEEQKMNERYQQRIAELLRKESDLELQIKILNDQLIEHEKHLGFKNHMKTKHDKDLCRKHCKEAKFNVEKVDESKEDDDEETHNNFHYFPINDKNLKNVADADNVTSKNYHDTFEITSLKIKKEEQRNATKMSLLREKEHHDVTERENSIEEDRQYMMNFETINWLAKLCIQCKYQNDFIRKELRKLLMNNSNNNYEGAIDENSDNQNNDNNNMKIKKADSHHGKIKHESEGMKNPDQECRGIDGTFIDERFAILQQQIERYKMEQDVDAKQTQQEWSCLKINVQKMIDVTLLLSERIDCLQSEISSLKHRDLQSLQTAKATNSEKYQEKDRFLPDRVSKKDQSETDGNSKQQTYETEAANAKGGQNRENNGKKRIVRAEHTGTELLQRDDGPNSKSSLVSRTEDSLMQCMQSKVKSQSQECGKGTNDDILRDSYKELRRHSSENSTAFSTKRSSRFEFVEPDEDEKLKEELKQLMSNRELEAIQEDAVKEVATMIESIDAELEENEGVSEIHNEVDLGMAKSSEISLNTNKGKGYDKKGERKRKISNDWNGQVSEQFANEENSDEAGEDSGISQTEIDKYGGKMSCEARHGDKEGTEFGKSNSNYDGNMRKERIRKDTNNEVTNEHAEMNKSGKRETTSNANSLAYGYLTSLNEIMNPRYNEEFKYSHQGENKRRHSEIPLGRPMMKKQVKRHSYDSNFNSQPNHLHRRMFVPLPGLVNDGNETYNNQTKGNAEKHRDQHFLDKNEQTNEFLECRYGSRDQAKKKVISDAKKEKTSQNRSDFKSKCEQNTESDEVTDGNGRKQSELTHDAAEIPSETAGNTKEKLGTNQTKPTANLAQEILRRKNLEFEFRQETIAKKASEKAGKHRRLSTGKLSKKEKGEMISNEKPSNVESYRNNNSRSNSLAEDRMHNITINHKAKNEKKDQRDVEQYEETDEAEEGIGDQLATEEWGKELADYYFFGYGSQHSVLYSDYDDDFSVGYGDESEVIG